MILFPAIDLKDGQCVRLQQGDYQKTTTYGDPITLALKWQEQGAKYLHLVDLNGAKDGYLVNEQVIKKIIEAVRIPVQLGGGIRTLEDINYLLNLGVSRVILGSIAVTNQELLAKAIDKFSNKRVIVGVDAKDFLVAISGWTQLTSHNALEFCFNLEELGVDTIIFTDISRDGMLEGLNFEQLEIILNHTNLKIIASGGVKDEGDLKRAQEIGCSGVILGKAIYNNNINFTKVSQKYRS